MAYIIKKYVQCEGKEVNCVRLEMYYYLGGINYFTYKNERRGYYVSVSPLMKKGNCETYIGFTGRKMLVLECKRQSKKLAELAATHFAEAVFTLLNAIKSEGTVTEVNHEEMDKALDEYLPF